MAERCLTNGIEIKYIINQCDASYTHACLHDTQSSHSTKTCTLITKSHRFRCVWRDLLVVFYLGWLLLAYYCFAISLVLALITCTSRLVFAREGASSTLLHNEPHRATKEFHHNKTINSAVRVICLWAACNRNCNNFRMCLFASAGFYKTRCALTLHHFYWAREKWKNAHDKQRPVHKFLIMPSPTINNAGISVRSCEICA